jgi:hypothetical protein
MEILLSQRKKSAKILLLKDYCRLDEKDEKQDSPKYDGSVTFLTEYLSKDNKFISFELPHKKDKKRTKYYYRNELFMENFDLVSAASLAGYPKNVFNTSDDRHIRQHYGNPYAGMKIVTIERTIIKRGDKITLKVYSHTKTREVNDIYFKAWSNSLSVTFDLVKGNFITVRFDKGRKVTSKTFRTNSFFHLEQVLYGITRIHSQNDDGNKFTTDDDDVFMVEAMKSLGGSHSPTMETNESVLMNLITERFVKLKKIKVPNDYRLLLHTYYPTEPYLKKNDRKLVQSILDMFHIKSKVVSKILHDNVNLNVSVLVKLCYFLGSDYSKYIGNVDVSAFKYGNINLPDVYNKEAIKESITTRTQYELSKLDKENVCHLVNSLKESRNVLDYGYFNLLDDHFLMIKKLKDYYPDLKMKAKNMPDFNKEHSELTKLVSAIKKGWVIEYRFSDKVVEDIQKPIDLKIDLGDGTFGKIAFFPHILKREEEYDEEGTFMHHCVATYANKDTSIIISLRTEDETDRVTCEFDTSSGRLVQARHFCNKTPPEDMLMAIDKLKVKTAKWARLGMLNSLDKLKVPVKINGVEVKREPKEAKLDDRLFTYEVPF